MSCNPQLNFPQPAPEPDEFLSQAADQYLLDCIRGTDLQIANQAWNAIYNRYYLTVWKRLMRPGLDNDTRRGIFCRVWAAAFETFRQSEFEIKAGGLGGWLNRVTTNKINDHYRRKSTISLDTDHVIRWVSLDAPPLEDMVFDYLTDDAYRQMFLTAVAQLDNAQHRLILIGYLKGKRIQELAAELGMEPNTVSVYKKRALKKVREILEELRDAADDDSFAQ